MIVRSRWRRAGGLAAHLGRTDNDESVVVRDELCRDAPLETDQALRFFTAIAKTNVRAKRHLIHIKVSPGGPDLSDHQLASLIESVEDEHAIPSTMPRHVIEHRRGARAAHVHLVYSVADPPRRRSLGPTPNRKSALLFFHAI